MCCEIGCVHGSFSLFCKSLQHLHLSSSRERQGACTRPELFHFQHIGHCRRRSWPRRCRSRSSIEPSEHHQHNQAACKQHWPENTFHYFIYHSNTFLQLIKLLKPMEWSRKVVLNVFKVVVH